MPDISFAVDLLPYTNLGYDLGSSTKKWNIYGDLHGSVVGLTFPVTEVVGLTGAIAKADLLTALGLSTAMHFKGTYPGNIAPSSSTASSDFSTYESGDVVLGPNDKEYVYNKKGTAAASEWIELGPGSSWATSDHTHGNISNAGAKISNYNGANDAETTSTNLFLREDGKWAIPAYGEATDNKTKQSPITSSADVEYNILLKNSTGNTEETDGVKFVNVTGKHVTVNPSDGSITAPGGFNGNATTATSVDWNNGNGITNHPTTLAGYGITDAMAGDTAVNKVNIAKNDTTSTGTYPVAYAATTTATTSAKNDTLKKSTSSFYFQPSTGTLTATIFSGTASNVTTTADTTDTLYLVGVVSGATTALKHDTSITIKGGDITAGAWKATVINPNKGGTGVDSYAKGDILYAGAAIANSATTALSKLNIGSDGNVLISSSSLPAWYAGLTLAGAGTDASPYLATFGKDVVINGTLQIGSNTTYGDEYTPIYWNTNVPDKTTIVQTSTFTLTGNSSNIGTATIGSATNICANTEVISINVDEDKIQNLNSPITWTITNNQIVLSATVTSSVSVSGTIQFVKNKPTS